jgi:hypothetical protein
MDVIQYVQFAVEMCPIHRRDAKPYLRCPNDRHDELDKWMQKQHHRLNRYLVIGLTDCHQMNRRMGIGSIGRAKLSQVKKT